MSCIAVVNRDTPKKGEQIFKKKSHAPQPGNSRRLLDSFLFSRHSRPPLTNCPWRPAAFEIKKKEKRGRMWNRKAAGVCLCARDLSAEKSFWKQCRMKYKQRWKVWTPASSATIPHHNQYNLFNYFQYLHWCTQNTLQKWDSQPTPTCSPGEVQSSCTFSAKAKRKKKKERKRGEYMYIGN